MTERWSLAAGHLPDGWAIALVLACAAIAVVEGVVAFRRPRSPVPQRTRIAILGLRLLGIAALLAMAFELTVRVDQVGSVGRRLVVLVDRSASMAIPDAAEPGGPTQTRQERAREIWEAAASTRERWSAGGLVLDVRGFDGKTTPYSADLARTLEAEPDGAASDLARALTELQEEDSIHRTPLAGILVISDGLVAIDAVSDRHIETLAEELDVPLSTVSVGGPALRDLSVADVRAGEFAFVENVTEIETTIVAHGLSGERVEVELRRDGAPLHRQPLTLRSDGVPSTVRFEVAPDRIGQFVYEIVVPPVAGEATTENNRRAFVVKVLRDKVRVLHVAGRPDWDVRALRTLLRRDPNVELLSYYILRGMADIEREDTTAPLSLIPFPTDELFEEELGSFDLVILHNFDAVAHQVGQYVDNMAQYVVEGGALVLIGGDLAMSDGGYAPLAHLVPIDPRRISALERGRFAPQLTDAGRHHPITAWLKDGGGGGWASLPQLDTFNPLEPNSRAESIGGSVLLEHPTRTDRTGRPLPLLAVAEPGRGRTMVLATGSTWRMGFAPDLPLFDGARPYDLLWLGAVRWLLRDDTSGRLQLDTDKPRYRVGEAVELQVTALSPSYAAEPNVEVEWDLRELSANADDARTIDGGRWVTDGLGKRRHSVPDLPVGAYAATARRQLAEQSDDATGPSADDLPGAHEVRRVFIVEPPGRELARIDADPGIDRLRRIAEATGGVALSALGGDRLPADLPTADPRQLRAAAHVYGRTDIPLWNGWLSMLVLVAAFGAEWILRRRHAAP
jgi:hypothetical protein